MKVIELNLHLCCIFKSSRQKEKEGQENKWDRSPFYDDEILLGSVKVEMDNGLMVVLVILVVFLPLSEVLPCSVSVDTVL